MHLELWGRQWNGCYVNRLPSWLTIPIWPPGKSPKYRRSMKMLMTRPLLRLAEVDWAAGTPGKCPVGRSVLGRWGRSELKQLEQKIKKNKKIKKIKKVIRCF